MAVRPNYIPAGEDNSTVKQTFGRRRPNFVPDPNDTPAVRGDGADGQFDEARREAEKRSARAKEARWAQGQLTMNRQTSAGAIEVLRQMPQAIREMHLLCEEQGQNRHDVLQFFPAAGETAREVWRDYVQPPVELQTPPEVAVDEVAPKRATAKRPSKTREKETA